MMQANIITRASPAAEPLDLAEVKLYCRVDTDAEDATLGRMLTQARALVEAETNRVLCTRPLRALLPAFPAVGYVPGAPQRGRIALRAPLRRVTRLEYLDTAGAVQVMAADRYVADAAELPGFVALAAGMFWPATLCHPQAVKIDFIAGDITPVQADAAEDCLRAMEHPFVDGDAVRLKNSGGALPGGLAAGTPYYAVNCTPLALQLALTPGGPAVDITSAGSGLQYACAPDDGAGSALTGAMLQLVAHWFQHREGVSDFEQYKVPHGIDQQLRPYRVWGC